MRIFAIVCARNELPYLQHVLPYLESEGIEVALIDNGSTDGTIEAVRSGLFPNVVHVEPFPYEGSFDLSRQLAIKSELAANLSADWLIHQDADEILHAPANWGGLRRHIEIADSRGFNVVNFNELVMLPATAGSEDFINNNNYYYFFEPRPLRLMRAWKKAANLTSKASGGHILNGEDVYVYPERMILKHFIVRSQDHAYRKYLNRTFSPADLARGWHRNRLGFTRENLFIPSSGIHLHHLSDPKGMPAKLPRPVARHFWDWPR